MLDASEPAFDEIAVPILMPIDLVVHRAPRMRRDHRLDGSGGECLSQVRRIEGGVGHHSLGLHPLEQAMRTGDVARLPRGEHKARELAEPFDQGVNLGAQSPARAPERLRPVFFIVSEVGHTQPR